MTHPQEIKQALEMAVEESGKANISCCFFLVFPSFCSYCPSVLAFWLLPLARLACHSQFFQILKLITQAPLPPLILMFASSF